MNIWANAFKMPAPPEVTEQQKEFLSGVALKVRRRRMGQVASMTIESTRPFHHLGSQALVFLMPMLSSLFGKDGTGKIIKILENPKAMDFFVKELDRDTDENGAHHVKNGT